MICNECETVAHCLKNGCVSKQPAPVQQSRSDVEPVASYKGPKELWLQLHGDCSDEELTEPVDYTDDSVTWCWHQIYDSDVRYVREDIPPNVATPPAAKRQWVGLTEQERNDIEDYCEMIVGKPAFEAIEAKLKEKNL